MSALSRSFPAVGRIALPGMLLLLFAAPARADFKVDSPQIEPGGPVIEHSSSWGRDHSPARGRELSFNNSLGYGVTNWWFTEFAGEAIRTPGEDGAARSSALSWKNTFQFTTQEGAGVDLGAEVQYRRINRADTPDVLLLGALAQKEFGPLSAIVNLLFQQEIGTGATGGVDFGYAVQARWSFAEALGVSLEAFGAPGKIQRFAPAAEQDHRAGPVLSGSFGLGDYGAIGYEAGYLFGLTHAAPDGTFKWLLNYTFPF